MNQNAVHRMTLGQDAVYWGLLCLWQSSPNIIEGTLEAFARMNVRETTKILNSHTLNIYAISKYVEEALMRREWDAKSIG